MTAQEELETLTQALNQIKVGLQYIKHLSVSVSSSTRLTQHEKNLMRNAFLDLDSALNAVEEVLEGVQDSKQALTT